MKTTPFATTTDAIDSMRQRLTDDQNLKLLIEESINKANNIASGKEGSTKMDPQLYQAIEKINGWPTTTDGWLLYITEFSRWMPQQSDHQGWQDPIHGYSQEVYDNLCHFYFLLDQKVGADGNTVVQNIDGFKDWLVDYANLWGDFLNTTESFSDEILSTYENFAPYYRIEDSLVNGQPNNPSGWLTFNQFFARELNPGLRPINAPSDNKTVVAPADCTYRMMYPIDANSNITDTIIKKTHVIGNIADLLDGSPHAHKFANGTFVHYFLGPYSYHRFHAPVSGTIDECRAVNGLTYLEVNIADNGQYDAPDNSDSPAPPETGYQFNQARGILTIDTSTSEDGGIGIVGVVPVGMCQVSGVHMTATPNKKIAKGEEFGYFLFGGSDIILLFQEGKAPDINTCNKYRYYGTSISDCPDSLK